jgi:hypothetical protein
LLLGEEAQVETTLEVVVLVVFVVRLGKLVEEVHSSYQFLPTLA